MQINPEYENAKQNIERGKKKVEDNSKTTVGSFDGISKIMVAENATVANPTAPQTMFELSRAGQSVLK